MGEDLSCWQVVEICRGYGAATVAGKLFADLGCRVVKVETPEGDPLREDPTTQGGGLSLFELLCGSKDSVCVDTADPASEAPLRALLAHAEVLLVDEAGFRLIRERFGERDTLHEAFPRLTICACTAFGLNGPLAGWQASEEVLQAVSGVMSTTGHDGRPAVRIPGGMLTQATGMFAAISAISDVMRKRRNGAASLLDCNGLAAATAFMTTALPSYFLSGEAPVGIGNRHAMAAPWNTFPCSDGWLALCAGNEPSWRRLCATIERPDMLDDPRFATAGDRVAHVDALERELAAWTRRHSVAEAERLLDGNAIPCGAILPLDEVLAHPQFAARGLLRKVAETTLSGTVFHRNGEAPPLKEGRWRLGEATGEVLGSQLGVAPAEREQWSEAGLVGARPSRSAA
jgi:CoA:oxalate CoA-transferase